MRKIFLMICVALATLGVCGQTVTSTAGGLSSLVTNHNTTSLTVKGVMDVRDFQFITENLKSLSSLNLQSVSIAAYESETPVYGNLTSYAANEVPSMALAGHTALTQVTLPSNATSVGMGAFAGCSSLSSVAMFTALKTIAPYAFSATKLGSVVLPASTEYVGKGAFSHCASLTAVSIGSGTQSALEVSDEAFLDCKTLASLSLGTNLVRLGARALAGTAIKTIDLSAHKSLDEVGEYAMVAGSATTVKFPSSVRVIGNGVLLYTNVTSVTLPDALEEVPDFMLAGSKTTAIDLGATKIGSIGDYAFYRVTGPTEIVIPSTTTYIGTQAMSGMTGLQSVRTYATEVPILGDDVWSGVNQPAVTLYAPTEAMEDYRAAEQWKNFNIQEGVKKGDVNGDGQVDVTDVNTIIDYILGRMDQIPVFIFAAADLDNNNIIDVADVNGIIDIILGKATYAPAVINSRDVVTIDDFTIEPGQAKYVDVKLTHANEYPAMQCDIVLPDGLDVVDNSISTTSSTANHEIVCMQEGNRLRLLCFSMSGQRMGEEDDIVRLQLATDADLSASSRIVLENVVLSSTLNEAVHCAPTQTLVNTTTGIEKVKTDNANCKVWAQQSTIIIEADQPAQAQLIAVNGVSTPLVVMSGHNEYGDIAPGFYIVRVGNQSYKLVIK